MFVKACKTQNALKELDEIFTNLIVILNNEYILPENVTDEKLEYLPSYINCYSAILKEIDITEEQIVLLQRAAILMVRSYPKISSLYHDIMMESVIISFVNIYNCNEKIFDVFVQRFICEAVIWTCSEARTKDTEEGGKDEEDEKISYKNYVDIWKKLIDMNNKFYESQKVPPDVKKAITVQIFDELIKRLLVSTSKLNLKFTINSDIIETDPDAVNSLENGSDYLIFLNMVELYIDIIKSCNNNLFRKWIRKFSTHMIERSVNYPTASGYYKLLSQCLQKSDCIKYFDNAEEKEDKLVVFKKISRFLEGIISKIQYFSGELQLACLQLILTAPICFIKSLLPIIAPVFQVCVKIEDANTALYIQKLDLEFMICW